VPNDCARINLRARRKLLAALMPQGFPRVKPGAPVEPSMPLETQPQHHIGPYLASGWIPSAISEKAVSRQRQFHSMVIPCVVSTTVNRHRRKIVAGSSSAPDRPAPRQLGKQRSHDTCFATPCLVYSA